jgi:hypothetical protein
MKQGQNFTVEIVTVLEKFCGRFVRVGMSHGQFMDGRNIKAQGF